MKLFDTHCHLAGEELDPQAHELVKRAREGGVQGLALIAADEASLLRVQTLAAELKMGFPEMKILYTAGIHPHDSEKIDLLVWEQVLKSAHGSASAIGETGLDYFYDHSDRSVQREYFARHISLACETQKPLVIHCRNAKEDVLALLDIPEIKRHPNPGILHCFTEDRDVARRLLDLNFYISFSGIVSFRNAENLREIAAFVPADRILIETDSPWLAPIPQRGKRNEPLFVKHVFDCVLGLRKERPEELEALLWENSCRVYESTSN
jgi:TatD DNase family protein